MTEEQKRLFLRVGAELINASSPTVVTIEAHDDSTFRELKKMGLLQVKQAPTGLTDYTTFYNGTLLTEKGKALYSALS